MNISKLFRMVRFAFLAVLISASTLSIKASAHPSVNDVRKELALRIENLKKKAFVLRSNPNNYQLIQLFVMDKVNYVNFMRKYAPVVKLLMENFAINAKVDEATIYLNEHLMNVNGGMMAYAMEVNGYWDFDDISELNLGCMDDVEIRHKTRYLNHHRWVRTYRPNHPQPPMPGPAAPKPPVHVHPSQPAHGNQNFQPIPPQHGHFAPAPKGDNKPNTIHKANPPKPAPSARPQPAMPKAKPAQPQNPAQPQKPAQPPKPAQPQKPAQPPFPPQMP